MNDHHWFWLIDMMAILSTVRPVDFHTSRMFERLVCPADPREVSAFLWHTVDHLWLWYVWLPVGRVEAVASSNLIKRRPLWLSLMSTMPRDLTKIWWPEHQRVELRTCSMKYFSHCPVATIVWVWPTNWVWNVSPMTLSGRFLFGCSLSWRRMLDVWDTHREGFQGEENWLWGFLSRCLEP